MPVSPSQLLLLVAGLSAPSPAWRCTRNRFCTGPIAGGGNTCLQTQSSACRPLVRLDALPAPEPGELLGRVRTCACTQPMHTHVDAHTYTRARLAAVTIASASQGGGRKTEEDGRHPALSHVCGPALGRALWQTTWLGSKLMAALLQAS